MSVTFNTFPEVISLKMGTVCSSPGYGSISNTLIKNKDLLIVRRAMGFREMWKWEQARVQDCC